jgi:hypothetical protein
MANKSAWQAKRTKEGYPRIDGGRRGDRSPEMALPGSSRPRQQTDHRSLTTDNQEQPYGRGGGVA